MEKCHSALACYALKSFLSKNHFFKHKFYFWLVMKKKDTSKSEKIMSKNFPRGENFVSRMWVEPKDIHENFLDFFCILSKLSHTLEFQ